MSRRARIEFHTKTPNSQGTSRWGACLERQCLGEATWPEGSCLLHSSASVRESYLREGVVRQRRITLQGVEVTEQLWTEVLQQLSAGEKLQLTATGAVFPFKIRLENLDFPGCISLIGATLQDGFEVVGCTFSGGLLCSFADFTNSPAHIQNCKISQLDASYCYSEQYVAFDECEFIGPVRAEGVGGIFRIEASRVRDGLNLSESAASQISLARTTVEGSLEARNLEAHIVMASHTKIGDSSIGPVRSRQLDFSHASFSRRLQIDLGGSRLDLSAASFDAGGHVYVKDAAVRLDRLILGAPLVIVGGGSASVESLQSADAGRLTLSSIDLRKCNFYGAHDLESLRLDPTVLLPSAPGWWRTHRTCIADEYQWRAATTRWRKKDWSTNDNPANVKQNLLVGGAQPLTAAQISGVYRALRKGLEAQSNEPGAADFYYGEMEMRRVDDKTNLSERVILFGYWLVSGYGLRALRSLLLLAALLLVGALLMWRWGVAPPTLTRGDAVLGSAESLVPGINVAPRLTNAGRWISLGLRVFGPILIAFAALALRSRIRR